PRPRQAARRNGAASGRERSSTSALLDRKTGRRIQRVGLEHESKPRRGIAVLMNTGKDANVPDATVAQQRNQHFGDVARLIDAIEWTAIPFGLAWIERRR